MKLKTKTELLATNKVGLITYCQDLHLEIERIRIDASRYWRNRVEQAAAAAREACAAAARAVAHEVSSGPSDRGSEYASDAAYRVERAIHARGAKGGE